MIIRDKTVRKHLIRFEGEEKTMYEVGYGGALDEVMHVFLSSLIVYVLYRGKPDRYSLLPFAVPLIIDSDHFLPTYEEGLKVFHSAVFISILAVPFIVYGLVRMKKKIMFMGAVIYVVSIFNISMDLMKGGEITFMYPFSTTRYVLETSLTTNMRLSVLLLLGFSLMAAYVLRIYLDLDRNGLTLEPHTGHS